MCNSLIAEYTTCTTHSIYFARFVHFSGAIFIAKLLFAAYNIILYFHLSHYVCICSCNNPSVLAISGCNFFIQNNVI
ncbi:hypothetical protein EB796_018850 [Bugula neritina]|uniref:Uncharacterized protein n=1 Tax=Bugula neritina TaxID=10212 RepID=A0A7J7JAX5_BUGNE|nr:hypothetical protein EB796_018850 [Bugula neritina]